MMLFCAFTGLLARRLNPDQDKRGGSMSKGISINIGLNSVDPGHYQGWDGKLRACENDARDMNAIAATLGYESTLILTKDATADRVIKELALAARNLEPGATLFLSYSGHGGQVPDSNGDEDDATD